MTNFRFKPSQIPKFAKGYKHFKGALKYAKDVVSGKIIVSISPRLACSQFIKELELSENDKDYPFYFDKVEAERICCFAETQQHVKGKWASASLDKRYFVTEPWQKFILCLIFGWKKKSDGKRRYREVYIEVPRKNGKSFFASVIGLYMFLCDHEAGAEVYCGATSLSQAKKVFNPARRMLMLNKALRYKYNVEVKQLSLNLSDDSIFEPIVSKPQDGASPHCSILDEYHEHPDDSLYESQSTGQGARDQPLILAITTAGKDISSACHELHERVLKNQELPLDQQEQSLFGIIYSIDKDDDPFCIESLKKANPNYGISVNESFFEEVLSKAIKNVSFRNDYLTKHLDVWVAQKNAYFDILLWNKQGNSNLNIKDFIDCDCFLAIDMSAKFDLTVITTGFLRKESDGLKHLYVFQDTYLPEDTIEDTNNPNYKKYQKFANMTNKNTESGKLLTVIDGAEIDLDYIENEICSKIERYENIQEVIFDPWQARPIINRLAKRFPKLTIVEMNQTAKNLSPGMKEITGAMLSARIHHDNNAILTWNMQNVESKTDNNGNEFPTNKNPKLNKKDGAVTLIMVGSRVENYEPKVSLSKEIVNGRGFRVF